jgi:hypothetical protein
MTLTDIISKITQYAKKLIVTDNSSTTAASINQAGTGDALSITGTTGIGASVTTTTGTTLKLQQNNSNLGKGGLIEILTDQPSGDIIFDGASDGIFSFHNSSSAATKATLFTGAPVGINENTPSTQLHVGGAVTIGRVDTNIKGGEIRLNKALDNFATWFIDAFGSGANTNFRIYDGQSFVVRFAIDGSNGNVGINAPNPAKTLHVNGTVRLQGLPTYANNAAAIAGGLVADDVYKTAAGELRIVV